jgi:hypothetical protein
MGVATHPSRERRLLRTQYTSFTAALARFLAPQIWKQAHQVHRPKQTAGRWDLHPVLLVLLLMTWTTGDSEAERFATARAVYVARHQHGRRPGQTLSGFHAGWEERIPELVSAFLAAMISAKATGGCISRQWALVRSLG